MICKMKIKEEIFIWNYVYFKFDIIKSLKLISNKIEIIKRTTN
jgi:hypothetical protein